MGHSQETHAADVAATRKKLKACYDAGRKVAIYHGSTNSTRAQRLGDAEIIDISRLNRVLSINTEEQYALVEPNVPMDKLVEATLARGLLPPVVPEFPGITLGGAVQGGAGESSSFKHGGVHNCCGEYEIVLGNGDIVKASPARNRDLFWGTACSYGSLGIITLVKLRLVPAKRYVRLSYMPTDAKEAVDGLLRCTADKTADFVDGIIFSERSGVVMKGVLVDDKGDLPVARFSRSFDEWFYLHAAEVTKKGPQWSECIPVRDYLFRYDRGAFWMGRYSFKRLHVPFNRLTRFLFNPFCSTRTLYRLLHAVNISQEYLIQDICFPKETVRQFVKFVEEKLDVYPIWLLPIKPGQYEKFSPAFLRTDMGVDVGVWGEAKTDFENFVRLNRGVEALAKKLGGRKTLYAHSYYSREEFWDIYDEAWYAELRKKYHAEGIFPNVYEKTKVNERYRGSILKGAWSLLKSPFKLPFSG
jgi:FAD/FMN-containing dehydrogenase